MCVSVSPFCNGEEYAIVFGEQTGGVLSETNWVRSNGGKPSQMATIRHMGGMYRKLHISISTHLLIVLSVPQRLQPPLSRSEVEWSTSRSKWFLALRIFQSMIIEIHRNASWKDILHSGFLSKGVLEFVLKQTQESIVICDYIRRGRNPTHEVPFLNTESCILKYTANI